MPRQKWPEVSRLSDDPNNERADLPEVAVFASGRYASAWDHNGNPTAWSVWTDADLQKMAENDAKLRATGQPEPYIKPSHDAEPVPGFVGPLKFRAGKLYAEIRNAAKWVADQVKANLRPWRSAEILRAADAANFQGISGPVFKGLALLNTHPRVKTLDSAVYSEMFEEPGTVQGSAFVTFEEGAMPNAEQVLAALKALGMDEKLLRKVLDALGLSEGGGGEAPAGEAAPAAAEEKPVEMSDAAAKRLAKLEADNALLAASVAAQKQQRESDVALARSKEIAAFAEKVAVTHGRAVADRAKASAEVRVKSLPAGENFADGKDLMAEIFSEIAGLIGAPTMPRNPGVAGKPTGTEAFSEDAAKEEIFAECANPVERAFLKSAAGKTVLEKALAIRKENHGKEVVQ